MDRLEGPASAPAAQIPRPSIIKKAGVFALSGLLIWYAVMHPSQVGLGVGAVGILLSVIYTSYWRRRRETAAMQGVPIEKISFAVGMKRSLFGAPKGTPNPKWTRYASIPIFFIGTWALLYWFEFDRYDAIGRTIFATVLAVVAYCIS